MIIIYTLLSIFIAWIWVDYFRLIDIYEKERFLDFLSVFVLGCFSVFIVFGFEFYVFNTSKFVLNGELLNDFLYCVFRIGMIEEAAKLIPFIIFYFAFRSRINEPIDYLVYISVSALGFSAIENILYFQGYGPKIIDGRSILSSVGHMFDSSLIAYGIIRYKFRDKKGGIFGVVLFFFLAALSHGFYDFWLLSKGIGVKGWYITVLYFLITISFFVTILNNALNNSGFFTYKKVINSQKVVKRLFTYYAIIFIVQFILLSYSKSFKYALDNFNVSFFFTGAIIIITVLRLSRFKLIKGKWNNLKLELPFSLEFGGDSNFIHIRVKGDPFNEYHINIYYEEFFILSPLTYRNTYIGSDKLSYIEKKMFFKNEDSCYQTKMFHEREDGKFDYVYLKPKKKGITMSQEKYPIVALLVVSDPSVIDMQTITYKDFVFKEWVMLIPKKKKEL